jgi:tetratricopeptide (TPR) repeat protein
MAALLRREGRLDELSERLRGRRDLTSDRETRRAIDLRLAEVERERLARAEPAEQAAQALELARFYEEDLEDDRVAHEILLTQILHAEVIDRAFIDRFRGLAERSGDWDTFLVTCEDLARRVEGRDRMAALELWLELAERYGRQRGNIASALIAAERASRLDPARLDALVLRTEFHSRAGEWNQALALLEQQLALPTEEPERARILQAMSELLEDQLAQPARAAECCQQLIAIAGPSLEVVTRLERCYRRTADWPALLSTYELHITLAPTEEQRVEVIDEIAKLYGERRIQSPP